MNRSKQYKLASRSVDSIKSDLRQTIHEHHKQKRYKALHLKRIKLHHADPCETEAVSNQAVQDATTQLVKKLGEKRKPLATLRKAFEQDLGFVEVFLGTENSLPSLVGILSGTDVDLQLSAAWCLSNMASGTHEHTWKVLTAAGPYFITYLHSGSLPLQDQCCWALGNIAGDCQKCRNTLVSQGAVVPLVDLLHSSSPDVCQSAAFALSNLAQGGKSICSQLLKHNILSAAGSHLSVAVYNEHVDLTIEVAWLCFYIVSGVEKYSSIMKSGVDDVISNFLINLHSEALTNAPELITPLVRSVGNFACFKEYRDKIKNAGEMIDTLSHLLNSSYTHIRKETIWVLSNLSVDSEVVDLMRTRSLLPSLPNYLLSPPDTLKELLTCMCHISSHNGAAKECLIKAGLTSALLPCLQCADSDCVKLCVQLLGMLQYDNASKKLVIADSVLSSVEALQYHQNSEVQNLVCDLLSHSCKVGTAS